MRIRRGFVDGPDGQLHYREAGEGPPLLLLHLNSGTSTMYLPVLPRFAARFRVIAMDHPGYGDSEAPAEPYTTMAQWSAAALALLDGLGIAKAHLVGHMTGANIAADLAASWPERVDRLVLSEVFNWNTPERRAAHERLHRVVPPSLDLTHLEPLWQRAFGLSQREGLPIDWTTLYNQFVASIRLNALNLTRGEDAARVYGAMGWDGATPYAMCRHDVKAALARIRAPTLVLHGEKSILVRSHESMTAAVPGARGYLLPGGDVVSPLVEPDAWAQPILDFLTTA
jgi:pimeloyl-ACP methyl ester carboxylesterase